MKTVAVLAKYEGFSRIIEVPCFQNDTYIDIQFRANAMLKEQMQDLLLVLN